MGWVVVDVLIGAGVSGAKGHKDWPVLDKLLIGVSIKRFGLVTACLTKAIAEPPHLALLRRLESTGWLGNGYS